ncbi:helix-turn-helix transcriptional regulator [Paenibacillus allorhizosphaerae]|uniref:Arabinose operon regulatory protein n=1 Tax=Paenibacillus allorhizosphaerae TaxID=2849866 RepID=A0ABM8VBD1_9BACL|nr:AraC family transcriptional regulator [Paenibacillus allorhizosphaerae]CAG7617210.1 Arabinose operon regulatory protein [Paenibacillus allorhizosphaerae]
MDYEFLESFTPRILHVNHREQSYWEEFQYKLYRESTVMHLLAYVYTGEGMLELDHKKTSLSEGMIFQHRPGQRLLLTTSPERPLGHYSFSYQYGLVRWEGADSVWNDKSGILPIPEVFRVPDRSMKDDFENAFKFWTSKNKGYEWRVKLAMLDIVNKIDLLLENDPASNTAPHKYIEEAIGLMKANYSKPVSREWLAKQLSLSPGYFSIIFKRHTGFTPIEYLHKIRMDEAKKLLKTSRLAINEIAREVGLPDPFYFTRLFTAHVGIPPREFRNG